MISSTRKVLILDISTRSQYIKHQLSFKWTKTVSLGKRLASLRLRFLSRESICLLGKFVTTSYWSVLYPLLEMKRRRDLTLVSTG